jgi:putative transposase
MKAKRTAHTVYQLAYHFVWIPKFRAKMLGREVGERLAGMIREICGEHGWEVQGLEVMEDHVHLFVSCPPRYAPAQVMNIVKSLTARGLYEEFPQLRRVQWSGRIWADGYYVGSSGEHVTSELIRRYIEYQKAEESGPRQLRMFEKGLKGTAHKRGKPRRKG